MKKLLLLTALFGFSVSFSQTKRAHACATGKIASFKNSLALSQRVAAPSAYISHEKAYDVHFVHLNLNVERTTKTMSGSARSVATVTSTSIDTLAACYTRLW